MKKEAKTDLYSLETLESLKITSPVGWLALISTGLLITVVIFWGIYGNIPSKVKGKGILLKGGGILRVEAPGDGRVLTINVKSGDYVKKGDLIAHLEQPELVFKIDEAKREIAGVRDEILVSKKKKERKTLDNKLKKKELEREILINRFELYSKVISSHSGRVLEVRVAEGDNIKKGQAVVMMELSGDNIKDLEAVIYVDPLKGKKVKPGMLIQIYPSTVKAEEYGFIRGIVTHVDEYPSTWDGMMKTLQNRELVKRLAKGGAPIRLTVDLLPDSENRSGYKWSSSKGPSHKIQSGTICTSSVTVKKQPPLSLVLPILKKVLLGKSSK